MTQAPTIAFLTAAGLLYLVDSAVAQTGPAPTLSVFRRRMVAAFAEGGALHGGGLSSCAGSATACGEAAADVRPEGGALPARERRAAQLLDGASGPAAYAAARQAVCETRGLDPDGVPHDPSPDWRPSA